MGHQQTLTVLDALVVVQFVNPAFHFSYHHWFNPHAPLPLPPRLKRIKNFVDVIVQGFHIALVRFTIATAF